MKLRYVHHKLPFNPELSPFASHFMISIVYFQDTKEKEGKMLHYRNIKEATFNQSAGWHGGGRWQLSSLRLYLVIVNFVYYLEEWSNLHLSINRFALHLHEK